MIKKINNEKQNIYIFLLFTILAFSFHYFNDFLILKYTFKPFETFFHEIGHGFTALLFGGEIIKFHLEYNQGYIIHKTKDLFKPIVSFSGYVSASLFGFLLYISSIYIDKYIKIFLIGLSLFWFIYVDGIMTALILFFIMGVFMISWYLKIFGSYLLRFIGIYVMVSSIYSPTYLWTYTDNGDHISLSNQLFLPSSLFIILWLLIGVFFLYKAFKLSIGKV